MSFFGGVIFAASAAGLLPAVMFALGPQLRRWRDACGVPHRMHGSLRGMDRANAMDRRSVEGSAALLAGSFLVTLLPDVQQPITGDAVARMRTDRLRLPKRDLLRRAARPARSSSSAGSLLQGLLLARLVSADGVLSLAAALWSYLLVQSLFALVPGRRLRRAQRERGDPFDRAVSRLQGLLDDVTA